MSDLLSKYSEDPELLACYQELLELEAQYGPSHDEVTEQLIFLSRLLHTRKDFLNGLGFLMQARGALQDRGENLHPHMSVVLAELGENYLLQGMFIEALPYFEKALAIREALSISDNIETAQLFLKTAEVFGLQSQFAEAEEYLLRAFQVVQQVAPDTYDLLGDIGHNVGIVLLAKNEEDRAVLFLTDAIVHREQAFGITSLEVAESCLALEQGAKRLGQLPLAFRNLYRAIEILEMLNGDHDPQVQELKVRYREGIAKLDPSEISEEFSKRADEERADSTDHLASQNPPRIIEALIAAALVALEEKQEDLAKDILLLSQRSFAAPSTVTVEVLGQIEKLLLRPSAR